MKPAGGHGRTATEIRFPSDLVYLSIYSLSTFIATCSDKKRLDNFDRQTVSTAQRVIAPIIPAIDTRTDRCHEEMLMKTKIHLAVPLALAACVAALGVACAGDPGSDKDGEGAFPAANGKHP